ncbi:glycosyltransferase [Achromobacter xylosoxidans]
MKKLNAFGVSWFFAPYVGSADIDFFKRIKNTDISYVIVQVARDKRDEQIMRYSGPAHIERIEIDADHNNPRTSAARRAFVEGVLAAFEKSDRAFDFIISHSNELISHEAAARIKKKHPDLPWIAYFGDLFSRNPYISHMPGYPLVQEDTLIEQQTLRDADMIMLNNEYQRDLMFAGDMAKHVGKSMVIPHCFDPAMYQSDVKGDNGKFIFAHLGTLYHVKRTATPVLQAVDRLLEIYPEYRDRFEVRFYGGSPYPADLEMHRNMRFREHVRFESPVSYMSSLQLMQQADVLLLIDGMFNEQEDSLSVNPFFPGKLADYMGAGKPITAVTMAAGPTADILSRSRNLIADLRTDRIAYVMKRYLDGKVQPDFAVYKDYSIDVIAPKMEQAIRSIVKS